MLEKIRFGVTKVAIVCGGRRYGEAYLSKNVVNPRCTAERKRAWTVLDAMVARLGVEAIVQGAATGADYQAWAWAEARRFPCGSFAADWKPDGVTLDRAAGPKRNQRMLEESNPMAVIAFPGGDGTLDMVTRAEAAGVRVIRIDW